MTFWSWGVSAKETEVWRGCGLLTEGLGEVEEALWHLLTVISIQTREAGHTPPAGWHRACRGPPVTPLASTMGFQPPTLSHSVCSCWKWLAILQKRTQSPRGPSGLRRWVRVPDQKLDSCSPSKGSSCLRPPGFGQGLSLTLAGHSAGTGVG